MLSRTYHLELDGYDLATFNLLIENGTFRYHNLVIMIGSEEVQNSERIYLGRYDYSNCRYTIFSDARSEYIRQRVKSYSSRIDKIINSFLTRQLPRDIMALSQSIHNLSHELTSMIQVRDMLEKHDFF